jgi:hypothetical protein
MTPEQKKTCNRVVTMLKAVFPADFIKITFNLTPDKRTGKYKVITETFHK